MTNTTARTVTHWGTVDLEVAHGAVVAAHEPADDPDPSGYARLLTGSQQARVARPAIRRSWLEHGPGQATHARGHEPFVEVSWDEALDRLAAELARVRTQHGNEAIFAGSYGWASAGRFHHAQSQLKRFLTLFGGYVGAEDTYSHGAAERVVPRVLGRSFTTFQREHRPLEELARHTRLLVSFGGLPDANRAIVNGGTARHVLRPRLLEAKAAGCRFVAITPTRSHLEDELDAEWLAIRPGSDAAVLLGLIGELVHAELVDLDGVRRVASGVDHLLAEVRGELDGVRKDAAWAAVRSDLPAERLRLLARELVAERSLVNGTWGIQRTEHGEHAVWGVLALGTMLGQLDQSGGGFGFGYASMGSVGAPVCRPGAPGVPMPGPNPVTERIPVARIADMLLHPGQPYRFDGELRHYPDIALVWWAGGNPFHHHQDLTRLAEAFTRPATIVVHEPFWTATARHADIVLPTTTPLERRDLGGGSVDAALLAMPAVLAPYAQARDDHEILRGLADRLGFEAAFTDGRDVDGWLSWLYERFRAQDADLPDEATFWREGRATRQPDAAVRAAFEAFLADPDAAPLPTDTGRIILGAPHWAAQGLPTHPTWHEPGEWLGAASSEQLHLLSPQPGGKLHSQYDHVDDDRRGADGRERLRMHPGDAAVRGLADGATVRVSSPRGRCLATLEVTDRIRPGVVVLATGAWWDPAPDVDGAMVCRRGNPNVLTRDIGSSDWAQATAAHTCLVEVSPAGDAPAPRPHGPPERRRNHDDQCAGA